MPEHILGVNRNGSPKTSGRCPRSAAAIMDSPESPSVRTQMLVRVKMKKAGPLDKTDNVVSNTKRRRAALS